VVNANSSDDVLGAAWPAASERVALAGIAAIDWNHLRHARVAASRAG